MKIDIFLLISLLSFWITIYVLIYCFHETLLTYKDYRIWKYIFDDRSHSVEHIEYWTMYFLSSLSLILFLFIHSWGDPIEFINSSYFYIFLLPFWLAGTYLLKHITKERLW